MTQTTIQPAPKRYAHAYIRHFIIFALFVPAYYSFYGHDYYADVFVTGILAILFIINAVHKWSFDFKRNRIPALVLGGGVLLYNLACLYTYKHYPDILYWKTNQLNITVAYLFLITLLLLKEPATIISGKVLMWLKYSIIISNVAALILRLRGYSRIYIQNLLLIKTPLDPETKAFHWFYHSAGEYALHLILYMAFFMIYRKLFRNIWTYYISQGLLLICLVLTKAPGALLAATFLFGGQLLHYLIRRFPVIKENLLYIAPIVVVLIILPLIALFTKNETFHDRYLMWKGSLEIIRDNPQGFGTTFGVAPYETNYLPAGMFHAHNTFLAHMQQHSTLVGIVFLLLFLTIILFSALRKPNFQSLGIWLAVLFMLCMDFALQTMNLPFVLFMLYCMFFREKNKMTGRQ